MKNIFFRLSLVICLAISIGLLTSFREVKQQNISEPGISFKLNGTLKEFNKYPMGSINKFMNTFSLTMGASIVDAKGKDTEGVSLTVIANQNDFSAGKTYTIQTQGVSGKNSLEIHPDIPNENGQFWISSPGIAGQEQLSVTITELTDQYVKGTFGGNVFLFPEATTKATITEGSFYVKFNQ